MTTEEAIRILDPETRREALKEIPWDKRVDTDQEACRMVIAALRAQQEAESNEPLTLDELREMNGEPVWIKAKHYGVCPDVVNIVGKEDGDQFVRFCINYMLQENGYGKTWLAYRHKPEEGTT